MDPCVIATSRFTSGKCQSNVSQVGTCRTIADDAVRAFSRPADRMAEALVVAAASTELQRHAGGPRAPTVSTEDLGQLEGVAGSAW